MLIRRRRVPGVVPLLEADPWFAGLPPACRGWLAASARRLPLSDGQCAYHIADPPSGLYRVLSGGVRLISYPQDGRPLVNLTVTVGRWFGVLSTLDGGAQPHDATADGRALLLHIPIADIAAVAAVTPAFFRHLALLACQQQRAAIEQVGMTLLRSPSARLAHALLTMTGERPADGSLRVNQTDLADRAGLSRQMLGRLLAAAVESGLIRRRPGRIDILDREGLSALTR